MGIFDGFKEFRANRKKKKVEKCWKVIKNPKAVKEDRMGALHFLADLDDVAAAVPGLLKRFDYSLENGITDTREKEVALEGIVRWEKEALPYITDHLKTTTRIAWPIKLLVKLADEGTVAETLVSVLDFSAASFDQSAVNKNYDILCYLRDYKQPLLIEKLKPFLEDEDERVRFACAEAMIEQQDLKAAEVLEGFIHDDSSENRRIRKVVTDAFVKNSWPVKSPERFQHELVMEGIFFNKKNGQLETRR